MLQCVLIILVKRKIMSLEDGKYGMRTCNMHLYSDTPGIIYKILENKPLSTQKICEITGFSLRVVQTSTKKLCDCGLIDKCGEPFGAYTYKRRE